MHYPWILIRDYRDDVENNALCPTAAHLPTQPPSRLSQILHVRPQTLI